MSSLPRIFAVTTGAICRSPDYRARAAALAGLGASFGLLVRAPASSTAEYIEFLTMTAGREDGRAAEDAGPERDPLPSGRPAVLPSLFVHARPDVAAAVGADGVQLRLADLAPTDARRVFPKGWIGVSVHQPIEAEQAIGEGADYLVAGNLFESTSHPGRPGRGLQWLAEIVALGKPVVAIGGITADRIAAVREAGVWGVAAISAIWDTGDPAGAAAALLAAWEDSGDGVRLRVNGEPRQVRSPATLATLLAELELDSRAIVVELNRRIVRRPELAATTLRNGDSVELVHFVGGG